MVVAPEKQKKYNESNERTDETNLLMNENKTLIYLVRHGESLGNANNIFLGHTDLDLTERGYLQAESTAEYLRDVTFDAIYSSDLMRAYHTALPHGKIRNMEVSKLSSLREIFSGDWENKSIITLKEEYNNLFTVEWREKFGNFHMPNGESVPEAGERMFKALSELGERHIGKMILVAAHAAVIRAFVGRILRLTVEEFNTKLPFPKNASYSILEYKAGEFSLISYSNDSHLGELSTPLFR